MKEKKNFKEVLIKTSKSFGNLIPTILGVVLLVSLILTFLTKELMSKVFTGNPIIDPLVGAAVGSIAAGNPLVSYILGGELLTKGVSLIAVTAFIVTWVTVGSVQLPAEIKALGKKFAIYRNVLSFIFALIIAIITVGVMGLI